MSKSTRTATSLTRSGSRGVVVGQGEGYEEVMADVKSAIAFHLETFGSDMLEDSPVLEAFVAETVAGV